MAGVYTVKQVNSYIKNMFKQDFLLNSVSVKGEISNCKYHTSGHIYFTLKDADAALSVIMFASQAARLSFKLKDGMSVVVSGRVDVFDAAGKYQLYANTVQQEGIGELYQKYEQLKQYYEDMGYFAKEYKRPLPAFTRKLGVVTSKTGAAVQDIMNISRRRNPYIQIVLYPAYVQGEHAKQSVVNGITKLDKLGLDCIIVGRGGGSIEDLWAFNEPEVVEAVFNASTPIISAVGHETDFTLTDFVADMRAPTPSAAAELAVTEVAAVENKIFEYERRLKQQMMYSLTAKRDYLERLKLQMEYLNPVNQIYDKRQRLMNIEDKLNMLIKRCVADNRNRLRLYASRLEGLSPLKKLDMGYGYIEDSQNDRIVSVSQVSPEDEITVYLKDGSIRSKVIEVGEAWQKH
jgi:exodeoxyribonuclease VII large subunit